MRNRVRGFSRGSIIALKGDLKWLRRDHRYIQSKREFILHIEDDFRKDGFQRGQLLLAFLMVIHDGFVAGKQSLGLCLCFKKPQTRIFDDAVAMANLSILSYPPDLISEDATDAIKKSSTSCLASDLRKTTNSV